MSKGKSVLVGDLLFKQLLSAKQILERTKTVASQISKDYEGKKPLFIAVLNGSFIFAADLIREVTISSEISFIRMASYEGKSSTGEIKQILGLSDNIFQRDIIVIEDIIDSGLTMEKILNHFKERGARSIEICSLLVKPENLKIDIDIKYKCFDIKNEFVVGYGLDYNGQGRNLKDIYQLPTH